MNKNLLILGAGMYGTVVKEIAEEMGCFDKIDFLDDTFGTGEFEGDFHLPSIGKLSDYQCFGDQYTFAIAAMENPAVRKEWIDRLRSAQYRISTIVSPRAYISKSALILEGCVVEPFAGIQANVSIGVSTYVSMGSVVKQNAYVDDFCLIESNAVIMPGAWVAKNSIIDAGEVVQKAPVSFSIDQGGLKINKLPSTPTGSGWNFDDVM